MDTETTNFDVITSATCFFYKYGLGKDHCIKKFLNCIRRKNSVNASKTDNICIKNLDPWLKTELFLLLVTLPEKGGPEYWIDKEDQKNEDEYKVSDETDTDTSKVYSNKNSPLRIEVEKDRGRNIFRGY